MTKTTKTVREVTTEEREGLVRLFTRNGLILLFRENGVLRGSTRA